MKVGDQKHLLNLREDQKVQGNYGAEGQHVVPAAHLDPYVPFG